MEKDVASKEGSAIEEMLPKAALAAEKRKLEREFCVKISKKAIVAVVDALEHFNSDLVSGTAIQDKALEILEESCKLVQGRFRNCAYESEVYEKEYELSQALVDAVELYRDNHPDSQSWLKKVRSERDSASIHISIDFLEQWSSVLEPSSFSWLRGERADKIRAWETVALDLSKGVLPPLPDGGFLDLVRILNDIRRQLMHAFRSLLTVGASHVAEVVSDLTDIPSTEVLLYSVRERKETAVNKTNQRVLHQERLVDSIFKILCWRFFNRKTARRPRGLFLLLGGSGCGKTEIAKTIAQHWYCDASRLVEIDMSEYAEPAQLETSLSSSAGSKRKRKVELLDRLWEIVRKRPYSVILLDKIDKATSSVESFLLQVLSNEAPGDIEGNAFDFSKSIIFMTSDVGAAQPGFSCGCYEKNKHLEEQFEFSHDPDPVTFIRTHKCVLKHKRAVIKEARGFFGAEILDSLDNVFVMEFGDDHKKAVSRMLLREIVREIPEGRLLVHISDAALNVLLDNPWSMPPASGKTIKEALLADVRPWLSAGGGYNSAVVYVDALVGSNELSFRFEAHKQFLADRYLKQKDRTLGEVMANLRMKVQSTYKFFELRKTFLPLLDCPGKNRMQVMRHLFAICNLLPTFDCPPRERAFEEPATRKVVLDDLPMVEEEKEIFKGVWRRLLETDTGLAKASRIIIDAVVKIIDAPLQSPDHPPARYYLFLCLDDDGKRGLIELLNESLRSSDSGNSFFTCVKLNNNCRGEEVKKLLIDKVKERPNAVFMLDGVEYADLVLYRSLVKIFDEGTLEDGEGFTIDFRRAIVILTSEAANKRMIADLFDYQPRVLLNMATNQNVKRFRTELLHRVDEIILFDPVLPEHGGILRLPKRDICFAARPASTVLATFLSKLFCPHDNLKDVYYDMVKTRDIDEVMRTLNDVFSVNIYETVLNFLL